MQASEGLTLMTEYGGAVGALRRTYTPGKILAPARSIRMQIWSRPRSS
jgi:hypothetical protein